MLKQSLIGFACEAETCFIIAAKEFSLGKKLKRFSRTCAIQCILDRIHPQHTLPRSKCKLADQEYDAVSFSQSSTFISAVTRKKVLAGGFEYTMAMLRGKSSIREFNAIESRQLALARTQ